MGNRGFLHHYHAPPRHVKENRARSPFDSSRVGQANPKDFTLFVSVLFSPGRKIQTACKPGSVHAITDAGRPFLWDGCYHPPQATNPGGEPEISPHPCFHTMPAAPIRSCSRWGLPCPLCYQRGGALLPHRFTLTLGGPKAVCFLWHCPWGRPRRPLAGTVFPWSPDFPPVGFYSHQRPSNRLERAPYALRLGGVNQAPHRRRAPSGQRIFSTTQILWQKMPLEGADDIISRQAHVVADSGKITPEVL